MLQTAKLNYH